MKLYTTTESVTGSVIIDTGSKIKVPKKTDYVRIPKEWAKGLKTLSPSERQVLWVLKSYMGHSGLVCPKQETIAGITGHCKKQIERIIKSLKVKKVISTKRLGRKLSYTILV